MKKKLFALLPLFAMLVAGCTQPTSVDSSTTSSVNPDPSSSTTSVDPSSTSDDPSTSVGPSSTSIEDPSTSIEDPSSTSPVTPEVISTIAEAMAAAKGDVVTVEGVVTLIESKGLVLSDSTGSILVHYNKAPDKVLGDKMKIKGSISQYNGLNQFNNQNNACEISESTVTVAPLTPSVWGAAEYDAYKANPTGFEYVSMEVTLVTSSYKNFSVEGSSVTGSFSNPLATFDLSASVNGKKAEIVGFVGGVYQNRVQFYLGDLELIIPDPTSISITGETTLEVGKSTTLSASVLPADAIQEVTWSSSSESVATVTNDGVVTAHAAGAVNIKAKSTVNEAVYAEHTIAVTEPAPIVALTGLDIVVPGGVDQVEVGETLQLDVTPEPLGASLEGLTWHSSNELVATVSSEGLLNANSVGTVSITASVGEITDVYEFTVYETINTIAEVMAFNKGDKAITVGVVSCIYAKGIVISDASGSMIVYYNAVPTDVSVGDTVRVEGTLSEYNGLRQFKTTECTVTAHEDLVVTRTPENWTSTEFDAYKAAANSMEYVEMLVTVNTTGGSSSKFFTIEGSTTEGRFYSYSSEFDDELAAENNGKKFVVTGFTGGVYSSRVQFYLTAMTPYIPAPESVSISGPTTVVVGQTIKLSATVLPVDAPQGVIWSVNDDVIAKIDEEGNLTGLAKGGTMVFARSTFNDVGSAAYDITVVDPVGPNSVEVSGPTEVEVGKSITLEAVVGPAGAPQEVEWTVEGAHASIDENGVLTGLTAGDVTVTATAKGTDIGDSHFVTVVAASAEITEVYKNECTKNASNSNYNNSYTTTENGIDWLAQANQNVSNWGIGGKSLTEVHRLVYTKTAIAYDICKIEILFNSTWSVASASLTVTVHTTAADAESGENAIATFNPAIAASSTTTIEKADSASWENCFYRFDFAVNPNDTSKNKRIEIKSFTFFAMQ